VDWKQQPEHVYIHLLMLIGVALDSKFNLALKQVRMRVRACVRVRACACVRVRAYACVSVCALLFNAIP